ncbi:MAG TPA: hypothetical protein VNO86_07665 [Candidatus Binatia bacterium]|nr:hypothetical protein [Candidatus Binatia bacterium]
MAKRTRGRVRPGQRRPLDRSARQTSAPPAARPAAETPSEPTARAAVGLTPQEEARAAELERQFLEQEGTVAPSSRRTTSPAVALPRGSRPLDPREEYAYVARDLRRILLVQAGLIGVLVVLWVLIEGLRIVRI